MLLYLMKYDRFAKRIHRQVFSIFGQKVHAPMLSVHANFHRQPEYSLLSSVPKGNDLQSSGHDCMNDRMDVQAGQFIDIVRQQVTLRAHDGELGGSPTRFRTY